MELALVKLRDQCLAGLKNHAGSKRRDIAPVALPRHCSKKRPFRELRPAVVDVLHEALARLYYASANALDRRRLS